MINIPYEKVIEKIKASGISDEELNEKIKQKMDQLSGLISKEGAAHIVANELGIKLIEKTSGRLKIKEILSGMRNVECVGKVINISDIKEFSRKDGTISRVGSFTIADETGIIRVTCWGDQVENINKIKKDDIVKIISCFGKENQGRVELHLTDLSKIIINPPGENIEEIAPETIQFKRKKISELSDNMNDIEILGNIVSVEALRFFEICPHCQKRARQRREEFECDTHGIIEPTYSYVMNLLVDDGTGNIRVVCFGEIVEKILNLDKADLIGLKNSHDLEPLKKSILGNFAKVKGRTRRNQMFDRLELSCQEIDINPDPYEEMELIDREIAEAKAKNEVQSIEEI